MATEILPVASGAASSSDIVVAPGEYLTVALKNAGETLVRHAARVIILLKDDDGEYFEQTELSSPNRTALVIIGPGTYQFRRVANGISCGVFSG